MAAAKKSFLQGDDWAYTAGIVAILLGAALIFFLFPKRDAERELLAQYHDRGLRRPGAGSRPWTPAGRRRPWAERCCV